MQNYDKYFLQIMEQRDSQLTQGEVVELYNILKEDCQEQFKEQGSKNEDKR